MNVAQVIYFKVTFHASYMIVGRIQSFYDD